MFTTMRRIHEDEKGLETLQVVMIIAVAAIILALVKLFWGKITTWFNQVTNFITQWTQ